MPSESMISVIRGRLSLVVKAGSMKKDRDDPGLLALSPGSRSYASDIFRAEDASVRSKASMRETPLSRRTK